MCFARETIQSYQALYTMVSNRTKYCIPWYPIVPTTVVAYVFRAGNNDSAWIFIFFEIMKKSDDPPQKALWYQYSVLQNRKRW
jgi:hypothetical protein